MAHKVANPFLLSFVGHLEGRVYPTISTDLSKIITMGKDDLILMWNVQDMTSRKQIEINNYDNEIFNCIDYCQEDGIFVVGSQKGNVWMINENNTLDKMLIYNGSKRIQCVKFSPSYQYLAIASNQDRGVVYYKKSRRFVRCDSGHQGQVTYSSFLYNEKTLITIGSDGYANIYNHNPQYQNPLQINSRFKIYNKQNINIKQYINFSQRIQYINQISIGGAINLQQIKLIENQWIYNIKIDIRQKQDIRNLCWINQCIIVLSTEINISLWNYVTQNKFHVIHDLALHPILTDGWEFFGTDLRGIIYKYQNIDLFTTQINESKLHQINLQTPQVNYQQAIVKEPVVNCIAIKKPKKKKQEISKAVRLITKTLQIGIAQSYEMYGDKQFLYYNQYGCIIKRIDDGDIILQLQYHDTCKIRRIKFQKRGKYYCFFIINQTCFMYSNHSHVYFQMEYYRYRIQNDGTNCQQLYINKWDCQIQEIQGIAIGNTWVAVATITEIRILDFSGNDLHCICVDRNFKVIAAYEDLLVIVYHASIPFGQSNVFEMKIYSVGDQIFKLIKKTIMPIKSQQELKWFGFSKEGCIFNQDTSETVRMYCWNLDQWVNVFEEDRNKYKLYIKHIQKNEIHGFKIEQRQGEPCSPTVLPRLIPRTIYFEFPEHRLKLLTQLQNKQFQSIYLRKLSLEHQKYRNKRWYKYKYSRNYDNRMYRYSQSIKNDQQIKQMIVQLDIFMVEQLKKILPNLQIRSSKDDYDRVKMQIMASCSFLAYYPETVIKVKKMLNMENIFIQFDDPVENCHHEFITKYKNLRRFDVMCSRGWIDNMDIKWQKNQ